MRPPLNGMLEYGLYVDDVARASEFYERVFGGRVMFANERIAALDVEGRAVLLLFKKGASLDSVLTDEGFLPGHGGEGTQHFAFAIEAGDLDAWEAWLVENGIEIEGRINWERGGKSLYFRDPDQHCVEVATRGTWETY